MADLVKREDRGVEPVELIDRLFDDWTRLIPFRRSWMFPDEMLRDDMIRVDEFQEGEELVIRAELPGIDPDKDVEVTVSEGMLHIRAERRHEEEKSGRGFRRRELRYGSLARSLRLPAGVRESDISASYVNGILEIRIPTPKTSATKVPIAKQ